MRIRLEEMVGVRAEVRGKGLMIGIDFGEAVARPIAEAAFDRGVLVNDATPTTVRLVPPLVITDEELDRAAAVLEEVLGEI